METTETTITVEDIVNRAFELGATGVYSDIRPGRTREIVMCWPALHGNLYTGFQIRHEKPHSRIAQQLLAHMEYMVEAYGERVVRDGIVNLPDPVYQEVEIVPGSRELYSMDIEEGVIYDRTDGKHVEMSMSFIDTYDPLLVISKYRDREQAAIAFEPEQGIILNLAEAAYLRELLNRPTVVALLDLSKEELQARCTGITREELDRLADMMDEEM